MPATLPAKEVGNLISSPEFPNAVQWAEDGTLAVAEGNGITLLNPSALNGPRSFCAVEGFARDDVTEAAGVLRSNQGSSVHYDLATSSIIQSAAGGKDSAGSESGGREKRDASSQPRKSLVSPRAMAWSPPAAGPWGSSLLATVLTDHRIIVYGPQQGMSPEWKELVSLHHDLLNYMANESCDVQTETRPVSPPDPPKARSRKPQPSSKPAEPQKGLKSDSLNLNTNEVQGRSCAVESESIEKLQLPATTNTHHSTEPLTKQQAALEAVSRFFTLRRQLSAPEVPTYPTPNSHLKDADLSCLKQAMDAVWGEQNSGQNFKALGVTRKVFEIECRYQLRLAWDRFNNVTREGYEEIVGLQGPGGPARHASEEQVKQEYGETTESDEEEVFDARRTRTSKRTKAPEPKDTVSWLDLPPVNTQSAGDYKKSLISGAVKRFLCVRSDSEEEVVTYRSSSQHLKAQDVALLERVVEEYMEAFEEALGALNLGKATFQQLVTVQLRKMWDRATGRCIPPDLNFKETSRDILVANGGAKSNGDDGPPVVPILGIASHRLSGSGVRGRGGSRGKTRGGGGGGNLTDQPTSGKLCTSPQEYERRLLSLSSISCAWSPILNDQNDMRFSLLAVGTKEGRVWLWRYRHGVANAYVDAFDGPSRFTFLGCCFPGRDNSSTSNVPVAWSSALSWVKIQGDRDGVKPERVVLVTGASDGSISLSARKVCDLQATELSAGNVLDNLDAALLRGNGGTRLSQVVTCISAKVVLGGSRLVVVAAGGMGIVKIWAGGVKGGQNSVFIEQEHVYFCSGFEDAGGNCPISAITGLCFTGPPEAGDDSSLSSPLMIVACNRQGSMASWSLPCDRIKALKGIVDGCEGPVACFKRMKPVRELGFGTFGLAASPGGGFVVTARCALPKGIDFVK